MSASGAPIASIVSGASMLTQAAELDHDLAGRERDRRLIVVVGVTTFSVSCVVLDRE
jgi:hypothetical protein